MTISKNDLTKIEQAQALLDAAYADYFARSDGYCKSGEGYVSITGGTYFERANADSPEPLAIEVYSYVFASGRRALFAGLDAAQQFLDWAKKVHDEQLANQYDENGDLVELDAQGNVVDKWAGV